MAFIEKCEHSFMVAVDRRPPRGIDPRVRIKDCKKCGLTVYYFPKSLPEDKVKGENEKDCIEGRGRLFFYPD